MHAHNPSHANLPGPGDPSTQEPVQDHMVSVPMYVSIYIILLVLLAATIGASGLGLGWWGQVIALLIAVTKAMLVLLFFMHVKYKIGRAHV